MHHWITGTVTAFFIGCGTVAMAQVFTQAPGAVVGFTPEGTGQALYGGLGLDSVNDPEYNIYRKFLKRDSDAPLSSATNVEGNPGEIEWMDVNQRQGLAGQPKDGLTAPGMFIGTKNHKTEDGWVVSNPDQLLYFKPLIDNSEDASVDGDSNRNVFWDTRFGFMENPQDYIDFVEPNSEQLDLWTGQFNTDAVYAGNLMRRNDSAATTNVTSQITGGGSFKLQSGSEFTSIANEGGRTNYAMERVRVGTDEEVDRASQADTGVAYEDPVEVSWGMRLNDPENSDEFFAREVRFWVKTGNVITSGIFDPGGGEQSPTDFPPNAGDPEDFTDFIFNWQDSFPVFFAGAQGNAQGTGRMGIFIPGDFGADGAVNLDDFDRLAANWGAAGTTYSRGDHTQDGFTNEADAAAWAELAGADVKAESIAAVSADVDAGGSMYDFNGSGATDAADLTFITDLLGAIGLAGDCNGDGAVDALDLACVATVDERDIVLGVLNTLPGDLDGDGTVAFPDFLVLSTNFNDATKTAYNQGDIDLAGGVVFADFLIMSTNFNKTPAGAAAVPEPASLAMLIWCGVLLAVRRRR